MSESTMAQGYAMLTAQEASIAQPATAPARRLSRLATAGVALAGMLSVLPASESKVAAQEFEAVYVDTSLNAQDEEDIAMLRRTLPLGPCVTDRENGQLQYPQNCSNAIQRGRTALVSFGLPLPQAELIAKATEQRLQTSTQGLLGGSVTAIPASAEAIAMFRPHCVDQKDVRTLPSAVAEQTMKDQLAGYDYVVGLTTLYECKVGEGTMGVANVDRARSADAFLGLAQDSDPATLSDVERTMAVDIVVHERSHLDGLGHFGTLYGKNVELRAAADKNGIIFLRHYIDGAAYSLYGGNDSMSGVDEYPNVQMNAVHRSFLQARADQAPEGRLPGAVDLAEKPVTILPERAEAGSYVHIPLQDPIIKSLASSDTYTTFDSIAVVPLVATDKPTGKTGIDGAQLYAVDSRTKTVAAVGGQLGAVQETYSWKFAINNSIVTVSTNNSEVRITQG